MADDGVDDGSAAEWQRLHAEQLDLRRALAQDLDPDERAGLFREVETGRDAIAKIEQGNDQVGAHSTGSTGTDHDQPNDGWFRPEAHGPDAVEGGQPVRAHDEELDELLTSLTGDSHDVHASRAVPPNANRSLKVSVSVLLAVTAGAIGMALLIGMGALIWLVASNQASDAAGGGETNLVAETDGGSVDLDDELTDLRGRLDVLGLDEVTAELRGSVIHLTGTVQSNEDLQAALNAAAGVAGGVEVVTSALVVVDRTAEGDLAQETETQSVQREAALQGEVNRITAATPVIFGVGVSELTELQLRVLNNLASAMLAYPDLPVTIVGYTDAQGDPNANTQLSLIRAANVQSYLVSQGVPQSRLTIEARGEETASGSETLAGLERRVEFEVGASTGAPLAPNTATLRIALVAPSASNDLAFTQSMVDAVNVIADERGNVQVSITDNTFVPAEAAAAIKDYADQNYDLIIAHGVEFGGTLLDIVRDNPKVTFAWGTSIDTFGLPNLYAYDAAAEEGGYVMGAISTMLSSNKVIGIIGPIEVGDAQRYVNGFQAGVRSELPSSSVLVDYIGSFSDIALAAEFAETHLASGADVLTGSGEMVVGAISVANDNGALWFGTQANQQSLAPNNVVASQVYHWEVVLRPIVTDIDAGTQNGQAHVAHLDNGGLIIEYNDQFDIPPAVRQRADQITANIITGDITIPTTG